MATFFIDQTSSSCLPRALIASGAAFAALSWTSCELQSYSLLQVGNRRHRGPGCPFRRGVGECPSQLVCRRQRAWSFGRGGRAWPGVLRARACLFASCAAGLLSACAAGVLPSGRAGVCPTRTRVLRTSGAGLLRAGRPLAPSSSSSSGLGRTRRSGLNPIGQLRALVPRTTRCSRLGHGLRFSANLTPRRWPKTDQAVPARRQIVR